MVVEITYRSSSIRGRGYKGEEPSHPCHKKLGGEGGKKKKISSYQGGDLAALSSWKAWYLVFAALGKDLTKPNLGLCL